MTFPSHFLFTSTKHRLETMWHFLSHVSTSLATIPAIGGYVFTNAQCNKLNDSMPPVVHSNMKLKTLGYFAVYTKCFTRIFLWRHEHDTLLSGRPQINHNQYTRMFCIFSSCILVVSSTRMLYHVSLCVTSIIIFKAIKQCNG